jgi:hypothetical protein
MRAPGYSTTHSHARTRRMESGKHLVLPMILYVTRYVNCSGTNANAIHNTFSDCEQVMCIEATVEGDTAQCTPHTPVDENFHLILAPFLS